MTHKLLALLITLLTTISAHSANAKRDVNQTLWYDKPASIWLEALPIGNSHLGAMVYGGTETEEVQLNEETFWSGGPHNNDSQTSLRYLTEVRSLIFDGCEKEAEDIINREFIKGPHGMRFLTLGSLKMQFGHTGATDYYRDLDLTRAVATVTYTANGVRYTRETFASMADGIIIMRLSASKKGALSFSMRHECPLPSSVSVSDDMLTATVMPVDQEGIKGAVTAECQAKVISDGSLTHTDKELNISDATTAIVIVSAATNYVNYHNVSGNPTEKNALYINKVKGMFTRSLQKSFGTLLQRHLAAYQPQYNRVSLNLTGTSTLPTDQRLDHFNGSGDMGMVALLFNYGRYLLITSSQPGGQPANLQGVWNDKVNAPWDSKYTININAEMNYWPAEVCNLSETHEPLFDMISDLSQTGSKTARDMYGCRGWVAHHNTDLWRIAGPIDGATWGMFPNGGAWLTTHLWQHYLYTLDMEFLRQYYPIIKGAAEFYLDYMVEHDGMLIVTPSTSPEHGGRGKKSTVTAGCTMDNQIAHDVLTQALIAAQTLGVDIALQAKLQRAISMLPLMKVGQYGQLQEWLEDLDDPRDEHRHISHLYGLYPSDQITPFDTPELWRAAGVTLTQRGDQATGWSLGWKTNFWARMLDGNHAFRIISNMLRLLPSESGSDMRKHPDGRTFPNLFDAHPPFQIDGNFGVTAGIAEMLMQSHRDAIHLLPALPDVWTSGSVTGLKARGGYEVSITWSDGALATATIIPTQSGKLRLRTKSELRQGTLVRTYPDININEYEIDVTANKPLKIEAKR